MHFQGPEVPSIGEFLNDLSFREGIPLRHLVHTPVVPDRDELH